MEGRILPRTAPVLSLLLVGCRLFDTYAFDTAHAGSVAVEGDVRDFQTDEPLGGIEVCAYGYEEEYPCTVTDGDGFYSLAVPPISEGILRYAHEDYKPVLYHGGSAGARRGTARVDAKVIPRDALAALSLLAFGTVLEEASFLGVIADDGDGVGGQTMRLEPYPEGAMGPIYFAGGLPDPELQATVDGLGVFGGLPDGDYTVAVEWTAGTCAANEHSWSTGVPGEVRLRAVSDHISTTHDVSCTPASDVPSE